MSLQAEIPVGISQSNNSIPQTATPNTDKHEEDDQSSNSSEDIAPSPKSAENQSTLFRSKQFQYQTNQKNFLHKISFDGRHNAAMSRKDTKEFK